MIMISLKIIAAINQDVVSDKGNLESYSWLLSQTEIFLKAAPVEKILTGNSTIDSTYYWSNDRRKGQSVQSIGCINSSFSNVELEPWQIAAFLYVGSGSVASLAPEMFSLVSGTEHFLLLQVDYTQVTIDFSKQLLSMLRATPDYNSGTILDDPTVHPTYQTLSPSNRDAYVKEFDIERESLGALYMGSSSERYATCYEFLHRCTDLHVRLDLQDTSRVSEFGRILDNSGVVITSVNITNVLEYGVPMDSFRNLPIHSKAPVLFSMCGFNFQNGTQCMLEPSLDSCQNRIKSILWERDNDDGC
jgi:hypothetical protein